MNETKYLIVEDHGFEQAIVFSNLLKHVDVAGGFKVVSGGFCQLKFDKLDDCFTAICYGESISCKVESRGELDEEIIERGLR